MSTLLPQDSNDNPIPALRLKLGGAHSIAATASATRNSTAFNENVQIVSVYSDVPVYLAFGDASVSATTSDHFFPAGIYYDFCIGGNDTAHRTHLSVLSASGDGTVYISEKE